MESPGHLLGTRGGEIRMGRPGGTLVGDSNLTREANLVTRQ